MTVSCFAVRRERIFAAEVASRFSISTVNASPSISRLLWRSRKGNSTAASFPSVVAYFFNSLITSMLVTVIDSRNWFLLCSILLTMFYGADHFLELLLLSRFIFQAPLKSGFVFADMIEE